MLTPPSESDPFSALPAAIFTCPLCQARVGASDLTCPTCGANQAWAAALAERHVLDAMQAAGLSEAPRLALPRFGEFLLRRGDITEPQLQAALAHQAAIAQRGLQHTIGQTLFEMGAVTREQLDRASIEQVRQLQAALEDSHHRLEQKVAERTRELQQALERLAALSDLKANFVANISHFLRTPLTSIKGYSTLLATGQMGQLSEAQQKAVETIAQAAVRLEETVNEILLFSPGPQNQVQVQRAPLALPDLAERLQAFFAPRAAASRLRLSFALPPDLPAVWADADKIRWVLFQLFDQAIKFTPPDGEVALEAELAGPQVRLTVRDGAPGLPPDSLDDVFQPLPDSSVHLVENAGLGLALIKRILEAHHSSLQIESLPGQGTRMSFALPAAGRD